MNAIDWMIEHWSGSPPELAEVIPAGVVARQYVYEEPADDPIEFGDDVEQVDVSVVLEALERAISKAGAAAVIAGEIGVYPSVIRRVRNREKSPSERLANRLGFEVRRDVITTNKLRRMSYWMPVTNHDNPRAHARFSGGKS